jgi:hypothetical protein
MVPKILARLSYANIASTLALFLALGGTAYAAATIGSADIVNNSIRGKDIHNRTIQNKDIASGVLTPRLYGNIASDGTLDKGRGILSSTRAGNGFYVVRFKRNIRNCVLLASIASTSNINPESRTIGTADYTGNTDNREAFVLIRNDFADTRDDADFSIAALC